MTLDLIGIDTKVFSVEHLSDSADSTRLLSSFVAGNDANGLERYLKTRAISDELCNESRTYLVRDAVTGDLACYFSLRTGLIAVSAGVGASFDTIPAIELANFAVNAPYRSSHSAMQRKIGAYVFNKFILPIARHVSSYVGVRCLYVYAIPKKKLLDYYMTLGFARLSADDEKFVYSHVKPRYDRGCVFMYQDI